MLVKRKNLVAELLLERNQNTSTAELSEQVASILKSKTTDLESTLFGVDLQSSTKRNDTFDFDLLDTDKIFHISQIQKICVDYRLRFLDSKLFKSKIPDEALYEIEKLEQLHRMEIKNLKIAAPSKLFQLENYDDPLLFAAMGNGYYYLVHQWGNDVSPLRKWLMMPFKSLGSFMTLLCILSLTVAFMIPVNILGKTSETIFRLVSFLFILKAFIGISIYYCFWKGKNFNSEIWNTEYYN